MYKFKIFAIALLSTIIIGCNKKEDVSNSMNNENIQKDDYVMNDNLSLSTYSDIAGYIPKDGLVPTAEIAFQIAEPILVNIFGEEHIEKEKPFSINLENDIWIIKGTPYYRKGGVAYIEIRKTNGEILKVVHEK
jgi:NADH dehydrogenase FAD-containing subunit